MAARLSSDRLRSILVAAVLHLPDHRTGPNRIYEMVDVALAAFGVFFWQVLITFMFTRLELDACAPSPPHRRQKRRR